LKHASGGGARNVAGILVTKAVLVPINIATTIVVARILGAHDRGLYAFLFLVATMILPLVSFQFGLGVAYHIGKAPERTRDIVGGSLAVGFLQGALAALVFYFLWRSSLLGVAGTELSLPYVLPVLCVTPVHGVNEIAKRILSANNWFAELNLLGIVDAVVRPLFLALLVLVLQMGLLGAVYAIVGSTLIVTLAHLIALIRRARPRWTIDVGFVRNSAAYGVRAWLGALTAQHARRLDWLLLGLFADPAALGVYAIASRIVELLWMLPDSAARPLFNRLTRAESIDFQWALTARVHRIIGVASIVVATVLGIAGIWVFPWLLGPEYADTPIYVAILLPGIIALLPAKLLSKFFAASGHPEIMGRLGLVSGVISLVCYSTAIPFFGAIGAAVASGVTYAARSVAACWLFKRLTSKSLMPLVGWQHDDVSWMKAQLRSLRPAKR